MNSFLESKAMAKLLRQSLAERNVDLSHSECLELVARQFGLADWNILSARIEADRAKQIPLPMVPGWFPTGFTDTQRYRIGLDPQAPGNALIECTVDRGIDLGNERFACMMQSIDAGNYRGMKLRLTASLRCEDADLGTIWMRVDGDSSRSLRFDNMMAREEEGPVRGTVGWKTRSIVLEIPNEAASLHYGFFLKGYGKVWARQFQLETAAEDAPTTETLPESAERKALPKQPANLELRAS